MKNSKKLRLLQTGDWHLDISPNTAPRHEDHAFFLRWLLQYLEEQKIEVLIHTGGIFDRHNASSISLKMLTDFLSHVSKITSLKKVIIISGHHDSNHFLEALYPLLKLSSTISFHLVSELHHQNNWQDDFIFPYYNDSGDLLAIFSALPYTPRIKLGGGHFELSHEQFNGIIQKKVFDHYQNLYVHSKKHFLHKQEPVPFIAIGHLRCAETTTTNNKQFEDIIPQSNSLKEALPPSAFPKEYHHVALGCFNNCLAIDQERIWYAGTPIATCKHEYQTRHVVQIDFTLSTKKIEKTTFPVPLPEFRKTRFYRGSIEEIFEQIKQDHNLDPIDSSEEVQLYHCSSQPLIYLYIELQDDISNAEFITKMTHLFPQGHIVRLIRKKEDIKQNTTENYITDLSAQNVFTEIYRHETGKDPSEDVLKLFLDIKDA
jgi:DNA repair protein SbcD/Mre11